MKISLPVKPLSVNAAFQGRRFKTKEARQYDRTLALMLPRARCEGEFYRIHYDFFLRNFLMTDWDNLIKVTQDCVVRQGIISDDRRIIEARVRKFKAPQDRIEIEIQAA